MAKKVDKAKKNINSKLKTDHEEFLAGAKLADKESGRAPESRE